MKRYISKIEDYEANLRPLASITLLTIKETVPYIKD